MPRVHDAVGKVPIVRQKNQTARLLVQATDRVDAPLPRIRDEVDRARARLARLIGAHDARRLVQRVVALAQAARLQRTPIHIDCGRLRIDFGPELGDDGPVDHDAAGSDQFVATPPGCDPVIGEEFVEAHQALGELRGRSGALRLREGAGLGLGAGFHRARGGDAGVQDTGPDECARLIGPKTASTGSRMQFGEVKGQLLVRVVVSHRGLARGVRL